VEVSSVARGCVLGRRGPDPQRVLNRDESRRGADSRRRLSVLLIALLLAASLAGANASDATALLLTPVDDSYVDDSRPTSNYGSRAFLRVDSTPLRTSFVKFDVTGYQPGDSASVRVYAQSTGDDLTLHQVTDTTWLESTITAANAPAVVSTPIASVEPVETGKSYLFDVSSVVTGDGTYSFAIRTTDNTAMRMSSSEGSNSPELLSPSPGSPSPFQVSGSGTSYTAASQSGGATYVGTAKAVVESAVDDLMQFGGGTVTFSAGTFDFGSEYLELDDVANIAFEGQGMNLTTLVNNSSAATDTEIFDVVGSDALTIRDMTVSAGGPARSTSDAIDFDRGNDTLIEDVRVSGARGRGIVFDGKGPGWTAENNVIRGCEVSGVPSDGIELLASSNNTIDGCTISDVGGHGIQATKASVNAGQPHKQSNGNQIVNNVIDQAGLDGVNINSSSNNTISNSIITNSADDTASKDGIRINSVNGISCDANEINNSTVTDNQVVKTQRYGVNISSSLCNGTVIGSGNDFSGNLVGDINDVGTNTQYAADTEAPSVPTGVGAVALSHFEVEVTWNASTDNVGVTEYKVYRDGAEVGSVDGSTLIYVDDTAAANTQYAYTVEAFDAATNASGQSTAATVTTPPPASSFTINPSADAYVNASNAARNYGSSSQLRTDASPDVRSYIRFDVSGVTGPVTAATLRIHANSSSSVGVDVSEVTDTTWTEGGITYDNAPLVGTLLGSQGSFSGGAYFEVDLTSHVTGDGTYVFAITTTSNTNISMGSRDSANMPELVISTA